MLAPPPQAPKHTQPQFYLCWVWSFPFSLCVLSELKNNSVKNAPAIGPVVPQECSACGKKFTIGGPIWSAPIHDQEWVVSTLTEVKSMKDRYPAYDKITSVLTTISEVLLWLLSVFYQVVIVGAFVMKLKWPVLVHLLWSETVANS